MAKRAPRVVILVENLPVPLDRRVWLEARTLRDMGWDVVVICPRGGPEMKGQRRLRDRMEGIEILRYPQFVAGGLAGYVAEYIPSMAFSLAWLVVSRLRGPVHVVHGCNPPDLFWLLGRLARTWGARYVFDQHDPNPELSLSKFGTRGLKASLLHRLTRALEEASYRTADLVLTVNETCRALALDRGRLDPAKVIVLRNVPDLAAHRRLGAAVEPDGRGVGYVGVMGTHDGLDVLLDAWAILKREPDLADARLELVGDGPARAALEGSLRDSPHAGSVRFWGFRPAAEYIPILAGCLVGVSPDPPTPFNDLASMTKIIDYMAIGRGCVAFGLTETARLGGPALKVAQTDDAAGLASALAAVLRDPVEARRLGALALARTQDPAFDWATYAERLTRAYADLVPDGMG